MGNYWLDKEPQAVSIPKEITEPIPTWTEQEVAALIAAGFLRIPAGYLISAERWPAEPAVELPAEFVPTLIDWNL